MLQVVEVVKNNPGCSMLVAAEAVGPNGSRKYGYRTVHRAISAGLVVVGQGHRRRSYVLSLPVAP